MSYEKRGVIFATYNLLVSIHPIYKIKLSNEIMFVSFYKKQFIIFFLLIIFILQNLLIKKNKIY